MPPIFNVKRREELRIKLLEIGIEMVRNNGICSISIEKVTKKAELGKGTFYHFFESKEQYISEMIHYSKEDMYNYINQIIEEKGNIDKESCEKFFDKFGLHDPRNLILYLRDEDRNWIQEHLSQEFGLNNRNEQNIMALLFTNNKNVKPDVDYHVVSNMMKLIASLINNSSELYTDALEVNYSILYHALINYIFV